MLDENKDWTYFWKLVIISLSVNLNNKKFQKMDERVSMWEVKYWLHSMYSTNIFYKKRSFLEIGVKTNLSIKINE